MRGHQPIAVAVAAFAVAAAAAAACWLFLEDGGTLGFKGKTQGGPAGGT